MHDKSFPGKRFGFFYFDNESIVQDSSPEDRKHNNVRYKRSVFRLQPQTMISFPHFLVGRGLCRWAGLCTSTAAHWPWKDAKSSGIRPSILGLPLILTGGMEPWLMGWFSWACSLGSVTYSHRSVTAERSLISSRGNVSGSSSDWTAETLEDTFSQLGGAARCT